MLSIRAMSSYEAVVPVSWSRLTEVILPAWTDVLAHRRTMASFSDEFAPGYREKRCRNEPFSSWTVPVAYLADVQWMSGMHFLPADNLRRSALHAAIEPRWLPEETMSLVGRAIIMSASELAGSDAFDDTDHHRFYGRLHAPPHTQVAGTKNKYFFLDAFFVVTWNPERRFYAYTPRSFVDGELIALWQALFLSTRTLPGLVVWADHGTWPASDDQSVQGILTPKEVQQLAAHLDRIDPRGLAGRDDLYPLFLDRVRRSAEQGKGLITLHDML